MKQLNKKSLKFCFISKSEQNYLPNYINLSRRDYYKNYSFKNVNLFGLKIYDPNVIVIDQYFMGDDYASLINSIKLNFKKAKIYFLSPEYADYNGVIQSVNHPNHFYSNLSLDIFNHINSIMIKDDDYLEAS